MKNDSIHHFQCQKFGYHHHWAKKTVLMPKIWSTNSIEKKASPHLFCNPEKSGFSENPVIWSSNQSALTN
jgi:hypothetical protein